jgi:hypothetical protein
VAKSSYSFQKRQKELERKRKKELKRQNKIDRKSSEAGENAATVQDEGETP